MSSLFKMNNVIILLTTCFAVLVSQASYASTISLPLGDELQYTLSGYASGAVGSTSFTNASFILTGTANTLYDSTNATSAPFVTNLITINGVGTTSFTDVFGFTGLKHNSFSYTLHPYFDVAFGGDTNDLIDLTSPVFNTSWDYTKPLSAVSVLFDGPGSSSSYVFATTIGALQIAEAKGLTLSVTQVSAVPLPPTLPLFLFATLGLCFYGAKGSNKPNHKATTRRLYNRANL